MWIIFKVFIELVTILLLGFGVLGYKARGILLNQGSDPYPLHWKVKSQPPDHQGSPHHVLF